MRFSPAAYRDEAGVMQRPMGSVRGTFASVWGAWHLYGDLQYDIAVVRLEDESFGDRAGYFGYTDNGGNGFAGWLQTDGYPGDKPFGTFIWQSAYIADANGRDFEFVMGDTLDVYPGQSGSPLWWRQAETGYTYVIAVVSYQWCAINPDRCTVRDQRGVCVKCPNPYGGNMACAINAVHYSAISNWR